MHCACRLLIVFSTDGLICNLQCVVRHLFTVLFDSLYLVYRLIHLLLQHFPLSLGGPNTCLCSGFALTVMPTSSVDIVRQSKTWQPFRHVLLLSRTHSVILITYCIQHEPAWTNPARAQVCPYGGTLLLLSPSWAVRVGQGVGDWCISQSGGLFRWVASCTNNDTWWKPLSLSHDRKWRWIVYWMGSDFVEQEVKNVFVVIILHNNCPQCSICRYWGHKF